MAPKVPPLTTTSPVLLSQVKVVPGSSLKVKVMVAVWPAKSCDLSLLMVSVGATVSMAWLLKLAKLVLTTALPKLSAKPVPTTLSATLPLARPAGGVTATV